jgi:hypothetical protein
VSGGGSTFLPQPWPGDALPVDIDAVVHAKARKLISALPEKSITLMEGIDAALHYGLSRECPHASFPKTSDKQHPDVQYTGPPTLTGNHVSLSGLPDALDGICAQEGCVLFATTNDYSLVDPALCRPGRMNEELFKPVHAPSFSNSTSVRDEEQTRDGPSLWTWKRILAWEISSICPSRSRSHSHSPSSRPPPSTL